MLFDFIAALEFFLILFFFIFQNFVLLSACRTLWTHPLVQHWGDVSAASGLTHHLLLVGGEKLLQQQPSGQHEGAAHQVRHQPLPDSHRDGEQLQLDRVAS